MVVGWPWGRGGGKIGGGQRGVGAATTASLTKRAAEAAELPEDVGAVLILPNVHLLDEVLATEVVTCLLTLFPQLLLDDDLRGDARVISPGDPEHIEAAHAVPAAQEVLHGDRQRVAEVERASDVGRRQADRELGSFVLRAAFGSVVARLLPP